MFTRALAVTVLGAFASSVTPTVASTQTANLGFAIEQARKADGYRDNRCRRDHVAFRYAREHRRFDRGPWAESPVVRRRSR